MECGDTYRRFGPVTDAALGMIAEELQGKRSIRYHIRHADDLDLIVN